MSDTLNRDLPNTTLEPAERAIACRASSWRICMAAGLARMSAALLISLAASTSARAAMTLLSPIRFWVAADDRLCWSSAEKVMSLRRIDSIEIPHFSAVASICAVSGWCGGTHNLGNFLRETLTVRDDTLENAATNDLAKGGLGTLNEGTDKVVDTKGSAVRRYNMPRDDRVDIDSNIVLCLHCLGWHLSELNLDVCGLVVACGRRSETTYQRH